MVNILQTFEIWTQNGLRIQEFADFDISAITFQLYAIERFGKNAAFVDPQNLGIEAKKLLYLVWLKKIRVIEIWLNISLYTGKITISLMCIL